MNKFLSWYNRHYTEITWFLMGWLIMSGLVQLQRTDYIGALIDFVLAYFNYLLYSRRM